MASLFLQPRRLHPTTLRRYLGFAAPEAYVERYYRQKSRMLFYDFPRIDKTTLGWSDWTGNDLRVEWLNFNLRLRQKLITAGPHFSIESPAKTRRIAGNAQSFRPLPCRLCRADDHIASQCRGRPLGAATGPRCFKCVRA